MHLGRAAGAPIKAAGAGLRRTIFQRGCNAVTIVSECTSHIYYGAAESTAFYGPTNKKHVLRASLTSRTFVKPFAS